MAAPQAASALVREYETIYILRPDVARESAERIGSRVEEAVSREGGKLTLVETWGRRRLAYAVHKHIRGVYYYVKYLGGGAVVDEVERNLRMLDDVLKYMTVQTRSEVDPASVDIDPERVKFAPLELPAEEEHEPSRERELGLDQSGEPPPRGLEPDEIDEVMDDDVPASEEGEEDDE
jgi:small subunit ribosomal protein S6